MKKVLVFLFLFVIGLGLFFLVIEPVEWEEIKEILFAFSSWKGIAILGITLLIWLARVWKYKFIFKFQGYNFSAWSLGEILFASFAITYLFPTSYFGGMAFKFYAIRKKFSLPWKKILAATTIEKLVSLNILLLFLVTGTVSFLLLSGSLFKNFGIIALVIIGALTIGLTIFYFKSFKKESILNPVRDSETGSRRQGSIISNGVKWFFRFLDKKNRNNYLVEDVEKEIYLFFDFRKIIMWKGLGIAFLNYFLVLIRCWLLLFFLKGEINIFISLAIFSFFYLSYIFPFPAQLGSSEAAHVFAFGYLGLGTAAGITFSFILRGAEVLVALFGFIFLMKLGIKFFFESKLKKIAS